MPVPKAMNATVVSKREFCDRVCTALRDGVPDLVVKPVGELTLHMQVKTSAGDMDGTSHLHRCYEEFQRSPHRLGDILERLVVGVRSSLNYSFDLETVIPIIKSPDWLQAQPAAARSALWTDAYNSDLTIAYAQYREGLMYGFLEACGLSRHAVLDLAMRNLRRMSPQIKIMGAAGFYTLSAGNMWNSSLMLLDELREHPDLGFSGGPVMAVPSRDCFHLVDDSRPLAVFQLGVTAVSDYLTQPYALCPRLFTWRGKSWERLDRQVHDPSQTIVNTAEVSQPEPDGQGGCILPLNIPDPLTRDARSVYRLFLKLSAYVQAAGSPEYCKHFGEATPASRCIRVRIHPSSDPAMKDTVRFAEHWLMDDSVKDTCVTLRIEEVRSGSVH